MTMPGWGRLTPSQMFMLMLAGHDLRRPRMPNDSPTDEDRLKSMAQERHELPRMTDHDFGYDLKCWHEHLLSRKESGYKHTYCWRVFRPALEKP